MPRYTSKIDPSLPIIAIDLGYSAKSRSCGFAHSGSDRSTDLGFGDCIRATLDLLERVGPHNLIIEAVLSTFHGPNGNPNIRGSFEKGRGWYHGPGVTTFAAALRFLRTCDHHLPPSLAIPLVEGFLSFKTSRTAHSNDAKQMLEEFETAERFQAAEGSEPIIPNILGVPEIRCFKAPM